MQAIRLLTCRGLALREGAPSLRTLAAGGSVQPVEQARERAALAFETSRRLEVLSRAEAFVAELQTHLAEAARCHAIAAGIIVELAANSGIR